MESTSTEPIFTASQSEELIKDYLSIHGYLPKRINTKQLSTGIKSPDFKVYEDNKPLFYCEIKNPLLLANDITKMFHWSTSISKIRRFIHRAAQQFCDIDKEHNLPWVIVFTSSHFQLNWTSFSDAYLGYVARNGKMICDLRQEKYVINYNSDVNAIDAFMWCQISPKDKKIFQFVPFVNMESGFKTKMENILSKLKPNASEDITDMNTRKYK